MQYQFALGDPATGPLSPKNFRSLTFGVCVLLLSALTVSAVSLSVSPNLQQFFRGSSSVSLSCVDDEQTVDGWTVRRTRGGLTEDCGAAAGFGRAEGSSCVLDRSFSSDGNYSCINSSGQQSDEISISVSDKTVILEIPALPVRTGNDVTLRCRERSGDTAAAFFFFNGRPVGSVLTAEHVIRQATQSDEGLYWCATDISGPSPQSFLRVRDSPPPTNSPPLTHTSSDSTPPPMNTSSPLTSFLTALIGGLLPVVLLVLVVVLVRVSFQYKKKNEENGAAELTYEQVVIKDQRKAGRRRGSSSFLWISREQHWKKGFWD
ncbi:uncharacterized protein LOC115775836 [Archocentrus centrarchus]|uniref:uncharacterized protein LOC115775836 n=1 Tax=Archocentrus centrarchus TaxID=63155 RepID=UPI0011EA3DD1|nr:uncharacterized protein LOC115775836 [Archocentrus centrarchus]